jgi:hypothetical protein
MTRIFRAPSYDTALRAIADFMLDQDVNSASRRLRDLVKEIDTSIRLKQQHPELSRRYNLSVGKTKEARENHEQLVSLKDKFRIGQLHECVLQHHSVLYGLSATDIVLLSIKHHRQAAFSLSTDE